MALKQEVKLEDGIVTVRELTVAEIRAWFDHVREAGVRPDIMSEDLLGGLTGDEILLMTDLERPQLETLSPSELGEVVEAIHAVNAAFLRLRDRLITMGAEILKREPGSVAGTAPAEPAQP